MTEYTPTTEEVRTAFGNYFREELCCEEHALFDYDGGFDRWLAEVKAQDRERIIALLEAEFYEEGVNMNTMLVSYGLVIALIKGEEQ